MPIEAEPNEVNQGYLRTKVERMGHQLRHQGIRVDEP